MKHVISITALLLVLWLGYNYLHHASAAPKPAFDHSVCQYPSRASNPVNACDNSDVACPEIIKGGTCE